MDLDPAHSMPNPNKKGDTMRQDNHGAALTKALQQSTTPLTASELRETVGCSRQRVYTWLQANEAHVDTVGKDSQGGQRYVWADKGATEATRVTRAVTIDRADDDGDGMTMRVSTVLVDAGEVVLVLVGPDGSVYHARPA